MLQPNDAGATKKRRDDPISCFLPTHKIISDGLNLTANEKAVGGMALGYADLEKIENTLVTERGSMPGFTAFLE